MSRYHRPGAYFERTDRARPQAVTIRTDVACFVGIARQGPLDMPVPVESFRQFQSQFGGFTGAGYLAYSVKAFFENGGQRCWIIRVASRRDDIGARAASYLTGPAGTGWQIAASSPGAWGNEIRIRLRRERRVQTALDVAHSKPALLRIENAAGLDRFSHLEITQPGLPEQIVVAASVDPGKRELSLTGDPGLFAYRWQSVTLDPDLPASLISISYAIDVYRDGRLVDHIPDLSQVPENLRYGAAVLALPDYIRAIRDGVPVPVVPSVIVNDLHHSVGSVPQPIPADIPDRRPLTGGRDGMTALTTGDFTGEPFDSRDGDAAALHKLRGLRALEFVDEISIVAVPDIVIRPDPDPLIDLEPLPSIDLCLDCPPPPESRRVVASGKGATELPPVFTDDQIYRVQSALITHCEERGDRFAVIDPPFGTSRNDAVGVSAIAAWRARFDTAYAALYYPWVRAFERRGTDTLRDIPPSGHVIGQYAAHDLRTGVHRAPANDRLLWLQDITLHTSFGQEEMLNDLSVNVIRSEAARGLKVMGARTLSSNPDARYVNIRRLILMIKRAVELLSQWVVFEPNNRETRTKYTSVLENFLAALWARGSFSGAAANEAFFVKCDEENNTQTDRDNGRLLAEIGIAPAYPFEFVVMRVGQQGNQLSIRETSSVARVA